MRTVAPPGKTLGGGRNDVTTCDFCRVHENKNKTIRPLSFRRCSLIGIPKVDNCTSSVIFILLYSFLEQAMLYAVVHFPNRVIRKLAIAPHWNRVSVARRCDMITEPFFCLFPITKASCSESRIPFTTVLAFIHSFLHFIFVWEKSYAIT